MGFYSIVAEWVNSKLNSLPLTLTLLVGIWFCISNRHRRPRVALVLGVVVAFQLSRQLGLWDVFCGGIEAIGDFVLAVGSFLRNPESWHASVMVWSAAIWASLCLDDRTWRDKPEKSLPK